MQKNGTMPQPNEPWNAHEKAKQFFDALDKNGDGLQIIDLLPFLNIMQDRILGLFLAPATKATSRVRKFHVPRQVEDSDTQ